MGNSSEQARETRTSQVLGQIVAAEAVATLKGYRAGAWAGETWLGRAITDGGGRFLLRVPEAQDGVRLRVSAPWQSAASERALSAAELDGSRELRVEAAPAAEETRVAIAAAAPAR